MGTTKPDVAVMIEGQNGVTWDDWRRIAETVEDAGFHGLFRSDHFTNADGPRTDALECWTSLTWLADNTDDIAFGPLVTPVSFRHPVFIARFAKEVDDLAGGRLTLGLGAGWQEREHETFGFDLLDPDARFDRFEEGVEVVASLLRADDPVTFEGTYYDLDGAQLLPRPDRPGGPPILVGGNGPERTLRIAARFADEWNGVFLPPERFEELNGRLDDYLREEGREPAEVRRSVMTRVLFWRTATERERVLDGDDPEDHRETGAIVGDAERVKEHLDRLGEAGADRVMLQWLEIDDLERLAALAEAIR
ncbi:MAG: TIGR03560 family F420-dependent LLM class oxidoreductase [Halodesulfurarchaeum sp.]